jgi:uncharacterized protein (DUF58 family)
VLPVVPTRRLAVAAAVATVLVLVVPSDLHGALVLLAVDGGLLLLALLDAALAPRPSEVRVQRDLPGVVALGGQDRLTWRIGNPTGRRLRVSVADELAPSLRAGDRRFGVKVAAGGVADASTALRPARRGLFRPTTLVVRVDGPLGLGARQQARSLPGELRVYPPFRSKAEAELRIDKARILEIGLRSAQGRGGGTEFDQLREYTVDDEFRRIDWSSTARLGKPIVRTYRAERNQNVVLLLDSGRIMAGRVGGVPRLEHAMDAVMMLTAVATRLGDRSGLLAFGTEVREVVPPSNRRNQLGRVTEAMYELEPQLGESDYRAAFSEALVRFRQRAMLVILTELSEQAVGEYLLPALPLIARHHVVLVASVQDPEVLAWAADEVDPADDVAQAYRKTAAVAALEERRRTTARLRGLGATVVDAAPGRLAPDLADAYLKVKATGRL